MPPMITIASTLIDSVNRKFSGNTERCHEASSAPAKPANEAPIAKACSFATVVLMPIARAASSSSRIACQAQPMRECCRRCDASSASASTTRNK